MMLADRSPPRGFWKKLSLGVASRLTPHGGVEELEVAMRRIL